jgi:thiol-disulfide isomerase/thioredoxin
MSKKSATASSAAGAAAPTDAKSDHKHGLVTELESEDALAQFVKLHQCVVVKFGTPTCRPCREIMPLLESTLSVYPKVHGGNVHAGKLDALAERYDVESYPTFVFFKNGNPQKHLLVAGADRTALATNIKSLAQI